MAAFVDMYIKEIRSDRFDTLLAIVYSNGPREELIRSWSIMYSAWTRQRFEYFSKTGGVAFKKGFEARDDRADFSAAGETGLGLMQSPLGTVRVLGLGAVVAAAASEGVSEFLSMAKGAIQHPLHPNSSRTYGESGDKWPPLAASTLEGRRKKGKGAAILRDTGMLFAAVSNLSVRPYYTGNSIRVVIALDSPRRYPAGSASVGDVAGFHQSGGPNLPQRVILVDLQKVAPHASQLTGSMAWSAKARSILDAVTGTARAETNIPEINVLEDVTGYKLYMAMQAVAKEVWMRAFKRYTGAAGNPTKILYVAPNFGPQPDSDLLPMRIRPN